VGRIRAVWEGEICGEDMMVERKKCWSKANMRAAVEERSGIRWSVRRLGVKGEVDAAAAAMVLSCPPMQ